MAKSPAKPKKSSAQSSARPRRALVPQPHGGALLPGGTGAPGTGRPKDVVREKLLYVANGKGLDFLTALMEGQVRVQLIGTCPHCQEETPLDPKALSHLLDQISTSIDQRLKGLDIALRHGLGKDDGETDQKLRQLAQAWRIAVVDRAIQELCPPDLAQALQTRMTALSHDLTPTQATAA